MNIAIITGASSGMGKEFARQLTEKVLGLDEVWLIARRSERLASLAKELPVEVRTFSMDLTDDADYKPLTELLGKEQPKVRVMINCAGYTWYDRSELPRTDENDISDPALYAKTELSDPVCFHCGNSATA